MAVDVAGVELTDVVVFAGAEFNGAPTAISQRCPGWPCAGLSPAPVALPAGTTAFNTGALVCPVFCKTPALSVTGTGVLTVAGVALLAKLLSNATLVSALESELLQAVNNKPETMIEKVIFFICLF